VLFVCLLLGPVLPARAEGDLDAIRSDVRTGPPPAPPSSDSPTPRPSAPPRDCAETGVTPEQREAIDDAKAGLFVGAVAVGAGVVTSPVWLPRALMDDNGSEALFPPYPYFDDHGFLMSDAWMSGLTARRVLAETLAGSPPADAASTEAAKGPLISLATDPTMRRWGGQFRADYADNLDRLSGVGGQLLLESTSRLGIDMSAQYLSERLPGDRTDHLTVGDCNVVYRFAQSPRAAMRIGLGANWLGDSERTDLGFNFTYGGDFFPRKPWVISSTIDWGTLGHAGLFRFQATAGAIINRFESYVGYEYLDVGSTQRNFLIGGVRVWF
jgi:hypothetical protein